MDWASLAALFQATMCRDHPGEWKCLHQRAQCYLAVASFIIVSILGHTPIRDPVSRTWGALCQTTQWLLIHFNAMPSQRHPVRRGQACPHLHSGPTAKGHLDRQSHHGLCLQRQRFRVANMALPGILTKVLSNRRNIQCREMVIWCLELSSMMKACPG